MAIYGEYGTIPGLVATGDQSSNQYKVMAFGSTAGTVKAATTAATDTIIGILQNDPADGEPAEVAAWGVCKALAAASVTAGAALTTNSTGQVTVTTTDLDQVVGFAIEASSAAGDLIAILVSRSTLSDS